jgi:hypothetical protein
MNREHQAFRILTLLEEHAAFFKAKRDEDGWWSVTVAVDGQSELTFHSQDMTNALAHAAMCVGCLPDVAIPYALQDCVRVVELHDGNTGTVLESLKVKA